MLNIRISGAKHVRPFGVGHAKEKFADRREDYRCTDRLARCRQGLIQGTKDTIGGAENAYGPGDFEGVDPM